MTYLIFQQSGSEIIHGEVDFSGLEATPHYLVGKDLDFTSNLGVDNYTDS